MCQNVESKLKRNIPLFYIYHFLTQIRVDNVLWLLYMQSKGLSLWEIGICESVLHISSLIFEIPTGAVGDYFGRKRSLQIGAFLHIVTYTLMLFGNSFYDFIIAFFVFGFAMTFISGSDTALIYDTYKMLGIEKNFKKAIGTFMAILIIGELTSNMTGGLLSRINWNAVYVGAIVSRSLYFFLVSSFYEPPRILSEKNRSYFRIVKNGVAQILKTKFLRWLTIFWVSISFFSSTVYFYSQTYFKSRGLSPFQVSVWFTVGSIIGIFVAKFAPKLDDLIGREKVLLLSIVTFSVPLMFYGYLPIVLSILVMLVTSNVVNIVDTLMGYYVNRKIDSEHRATANSVIGMGFSLSMIIFFPLFGLLSERLSYPTAFLFVGVVSLLLLALSLKKILRYSNY